MFVASDISVHINALMKMVFVLLKRAKQISHCCTDISLVCCMVGHFVSVTDLHENI
jgi:hypothetical protein